MQPISCWLAPPSRPAYKAPLLLLGALLALAYLLTSCAQQAAPQGGPQDEVPPEVIKTTPATGSLNYRSQDIQIRFNEPIRKPTFDKEIFISPLVERPEIRLSDNAKRLSIHFPDPLRPQTTYIITLNGVKDNSEGNPLEEPYVLAFSTGDVLDSLSFKGQIWTPVLSKGAEEMTVLLFDADSAINNDFLRKRPAYLTRTDKQGRFSFQYLRPARYRVLGLRDEDQSNSYSQPTEEIALSQDTVFTLFAPEPDSLHNASDSLALPVDSAVIPTDSLAVSGDSLRLQPDRLLAPVDSLTPNDTNPLAPTDSLSGRADSSEQVSLIDSLPSDTLVLDSLGNPISTADSLGVDSTVQKTERPDIELFAFTPDETGPQIRSYDLLNAHTARLTLTEKPRLDQLTAWSSDTLGQDSIPTIAMTLYQEDDKVRLLVQIPPILPREIHFHNLTDSLGNGIDSVLRIEEKPYSKLERPILQPPKLEAMQGRWALLLPRPWDDSLGQFISLTDTAAIDSNREEFEVQYESEDFFVYLKPDSLPDPTAPYILRMQGQTGAMRDSLLNDSTFSFKLSWFDSTNYGSLSGGVDIDTTYTGPVWIELLDKDGKLVAAQSDTAFFFPRLLAGDYTFRVILDTDSNQTWTPGQIHPLRMPERIYKVPEKVSLRANWEFEGHRVVVKVTDEPTRASSSSRPDQGDGPPDANAQSDGPLGGNRPGGRGGLGRRP